MTCGFNFTKSWVTYVGLYFLNLGLVFTLKCSITIPISFVFHVANEECKYTSLVLLHVDLVYRRFQLPMMDWGLYFPILGLVFDVKYYRIYYAATI